MQRGTSWVPLVRVKREASQVAEAAGAGIHLASGVERYEDAGADDGQSHQQDGAGAQEFGHCSSPSQEGMSI
jgi:hypothetical protein